jgi:hypothetical protein
MSPELKVYLDGKLTLTPTHLVRVFPPKPCPVERKKNIKKITFKFHQGLSIKLKLWSTTTIETQAFQQH